MSTDFAKKTCRMCRMDIPKDARKCPYCHHFQNRLSMILFHPAIAVLGACIPLAAFAIFFELMFDPGEDYQEFKDQIVITDSQMAFGERDSEGTVVVMGTIQNNSPVPWKEILFHTEFFDAKGKRVDVGQREEYSSYLPPNETSSFKVSFRREFSETNYVKHKIRVVAAKDGRARW